MKMSKNDDFVPQANRTNFGQEFKAENTQKIFRSNSSDNLLPHNNFKSSRMQDIAKNNIESSINKSMATNQNKVNANNLHVPKFNLNGGVPKMNEFFQNLQGVQFMSKNKDSLSNKIAL